MTTREQIEHEIRKQEQNGTILSFPDRDPKYGTWGSASYRGNWSGFIPAYFICRLKAETGIAEIFAGSGTTSDVARDMEIPYVGIDLNPNPVRDNIVCMNILDDSRELPEGFHSADIQFLHPPYPGINGIRYAGSMYRCDKATMESDIQNMPYEKGMKAVNHAVMRGYSAMKPGAWQVIMVGEIRSHGRYYSMFRDLVIPGTLHQTFVKQQHNTMSGRKSYGMKERDFAWTAFEVIAVIRKPSGYEIAFTLPRTFRTDIRDSRTATWKDVVVSAAHGLGSWFSLDQMYRELEGHDKAKNNNNVHAKIRQTLYRLCDSGVLVKQNDRYAIA